MLLSLLQDGENMTTIENVFTLQRICVVSGEEICSQIMQNKLFGFEHEHTSQSESHFYSFWSIRFSYFHFYTSTVNCYTSIK